MSKPNLVQGHRERLGLEDVTIHLLHSFHGLLMGVETDRGTGTKEFCTSLVTDLTREQGRRWKYRKLHILLASAQLLTYS